MQLVGAKRRYQLDQELVGWSSGNAAKYLKAEGFKYLKQNT